MRLFIYKAWGSVATILAGALALVHFAHPLPLYQIPDRGHRILAVPEEKYRVPVIEALMVGGLNPYGTFTAGLKQTLMWDGFTVVAAGQGLGSCAVSLPVDDPSEAAKRAQRALLKHGVRSTTFDPPELKGKLSVVKLPFGLDIAYRVHGSQMPPITWQSRWQQ